MRPLCAVRVETRTIVASGERETRWAAGVEASCKPAQAKMHLSTQTWLT